MDTRKNNLYEKLLYSPVTSLNPIKPLFIWENANRQLNKKYKTPEINLTDNPKDLEIKNSARHITGLGLAGSQYGYLAYPIGLIKEGLDLGKDLLKPPYGRVSPEVWEDTKTDIQNNHKGIQYMLQNPNASSDDLMNYAIGLAKQKQAETPTLYGHISNTPDK